MFRFTKNDVRELIELLEDELFAIQELNRFKKMKMRSKIRKQENWLVMFGNPTSEKIFKKLEDRLPDVFPLYPCGFSDKLRKLLEAKVTQLQKKAF